MTQKEQDFCIQRVMPITNEEQAIWQQPSWLIQLESQQTVLEKTQAAVAAQLRVVQARQERREQAQKLPIGQRQQLQFSLATFFEPTKKTNLAEVAELEQIRKKLDTELLNLRIRIALFKILLPATPPTESGE